MWLEDFQNTLVKHVVSRHMFRVSSCFPSPGLADACLPVPEDPWDREAAVVSEGSAVSLQRHCATNRLKMFET